MKLKDYRLKCKMTQKEAALFLGVSDKTYFRYENEDKYIGNLKYQNLLIDQHHFSLLPFLLRNFQTNNSN